MKYLCNLLLFLILVSPVYSLTENQIEEVYSEAINLRYEGDFAKSRFLLESLYLKGVTNEYVLTVLTEVYFDYLRDLSIKKDEVTIKNAYSGIRENIAKIWDLYPSSEAIQKNAIRIAWGLGDMRFALAMSLLSLEQNPYHLIANYFVGSYHLQQSNTIYAYPYFKKASKQEVSEGNEQFIFQSREYVADINFDRGNFTESINYYEKALELASNVSIIVKLAMSHARNGDFKEAMFYFEQIPIQTLTPELFDAYIGILYFRNTPNSRSKINRLLSQQYQEFPPFSKAIAFSKLGQTQKALSFLNKDLFLPIELPWVYNTFKIELLNRIQHKYQKNDSLMNIANDFIKQKKYQEAQTILSKV
ncbi:MAG: tetratricopeptide repeat protein, partial [Brevinema sp.]